DAEGRIKTDARVDPGDDREGDGLRNQREGDDEPGEHVATHVGEPVLFDRMQHGEPEKREWITQGWRRIAEHGGDFPGEARPIRGCGRTHSALRMKVSIPANPPFWLNMASITKNRKTGMPAFANRHRVALIVLLIL